MCLIVFSWQAQPGYPLVLVANRDEYHARPTEHLHWWPDHPSILAGRDLEAGGTWCGVSRSGRFAAITNYRDPAANEIDRISRGQITLDYLDSDIPAMDYLQGLDRQHEAWNGFNLILGDANQLCYYSNIQRRIMALEAGLYAVSNGLLDTPWPKVERSKQALQSCLSRLPDEEALLSVLADETPVDDEALPFTGVSLEWERLLSPCFIRNEEYGTRSSTLMRISESGEVSMRERCYDPQGNRSGDYRFSFTPA